jgi:hypothetical protein
MKRLGLFLLVAMAFGPRLAQADGGIVRARETRGISHLIFTLLKYSRLFPGVSVMVQDHRTNQVVTDLSWNSV